MLVSLQLGLQLVGLQFAPHYLSGAWRMTPRVAPAMRLSEEEEDRASDQRLLDALFGDSPEAQSYREMDPDVPSHAKLRVDEDGRPLLLRFVYVDELTCIGCTYCAEVARSTFYMNEDAGRARVFNQHGDDPMVVQEAIDSCPVNCISYVDHEDLVILETEREGIKINPMTIGIPATWSARMHAVPPTKAKLGKGSRICCNNCPGRGCKECPMYGVGLNPVYMERMAAKSSLREASGEAAKLRFDQSAQEILDSFLGSAPVTPLVVGMVVPLGEAPAEAPVAPLEGVVVSSQVKSSQVKSVEGVVVPVGDGADVPPAPVAALRSEDLLSADGPSAAFFDVLYAPPSEFLVDDVDDMPQPI
jgi:ferredoxin